MISQVNTPELDSLVDKVNTLEIKNMLSTQDIINLADCARRAKKEIGKLSQNAAIEIPAKIEMRLNNLTSRVSVEDKLLAESIVEYWASVRKPELDVEVRKKANEEVISSSELEDGISLITMIPVASSLSQRSGPTITQAKKLMRNSNSDLSKRTMLQRKNSSYRFVGVNTRPVREKLEKPTISVIGLTEDVSLYDKVSKGCYSSLFKGRGTGHFVSKKTK